MELIKNPVLIWFILGAMLLLVELFLPGLVIFFFGIGAIITALAVWLIPSLPLSIQLLVFLITSLVSLFLLRNKFSSILVGRDKTAGTSDEFLEGYIGKTAVVVEDIRPGIEGKVEFRGSWWKAKADVEIKTAEHVEIIGRENISFKVKPATIKNNQEVK
jgi:membrane protein implicated in regulation of membrane protease activity